MSRRGRQVGLSWAFGPAPRRTRELPQALVVATLAFAANLVAPAASFGQDVSPPRLGGYVQVRETWQETTNLTFTLNRVRLSADGSLPHSISYRVMAEYEAPATGRTPAGVSLRDAYVRWSRSPWSITGGQLKTPFSREYLTSITMVETADRSAVVDTLATKRDLGLMGEWTAPWAFAALGVFNGEGQNASLNRDSTSLYVGRLGLRPFSELTVATSVAFFGDDSSRVGLEASIEKYGGLLRGELINQHRHGRDQDDLGWFILAGWRFTPWLQLVARQEDFQRPSIGEDRRISATTGGANFELPGGRTRLLVNYVSKTTGFPRVRRDLWIGQAQVRF